MSRSFARSGMAILALGLLSLPATPSTAHSAADDSTFGASNLRPADGSQARARVVFLDSGDELVASGRARKLDPSQPYISLGYGQPDCRGGAVVVPLGAWQVDDKGKGELFNVDGASGGVLASLQTVSIRHAETRALVACGEVRPVVER